jgi:methionine sulfoxide reductase heme-binding subunit
VSDLLHSHLIWYVNRGTGVVLVAVLTLATALGVLATRGGSTRWPRFALQTLHRNVSLIACALLLGHATAPVLDTYVNHYAPIAALDAVVPFVSAYQPFALGLGTLAFDLIVVVVLTSALRRRLGHRTWFGVHLLTYVSWVLGVVHGLLIGTDARTTWSLAVTGTSVAVVLAAVAARLVHRRAPVPAPREYPESTVARDDHLLRDDDLLRDRRSRRRAAEPFLEPEPFFPPEPTPAADPFARAAAVPATRAVPVDRSMHGSVDPPLDGPMTRRDRRQAERLLDAAQQPPAEPELPTRRSRRGATA